MTKNYQPRWYNRAMVMIFVVPGIILILIAGGSMATQSIAASVGLVVCALLLLLWIVFITTSQVTLDSQNLTRSWAMGSVVIPLDEITRIAWGGGRGQINMIIRTKDNWVMLSSLSFKREELKEVENHILAARGIADQPRWPPYATTMIDLDEMIRRRGSL
jgi:uncharacterized membrane protein YobD (UPF0266 family)